MKYYGKILVTDSRRPFFMEKLKFPRNLIGAAEMWILERFKMLEPLSERVIKFYTYNDESDWDFEYDVPRYVFDDVCDVYSEFLESAKYIGQEILRKWSLYGNYYWDVKVSLSYSDFDYRDDCIKYTLNYMWEIIETDHPRAICANHTARKDCRWVREPFKYSMLEVKGYGISGDYRSFVYLLDGIQGKAIVCHSKYDVKVLMTVLRFLNVKHLKKNNRYYTNNPKKHCFFSKFTPAYRLERIEGDWVLVALSPFDIPTETEQIRDIDEIIVRRSLKARLRDLITITN